MLIEAPARTDWSEKAPVYLAGAAASSVAISIVASEVLLGLALVALLATGRKLRWPPITLPVVLWMVWTLVSLAASGHVRAGLPQVRTFYWFLMLLVVYSAVRTLREIRAVALGWTAAAAISAVWGLEQYVRKYLAAPDDFDRAYANDRITGFTGHWMIFSGLLMIALMMIGAILLFSKERKWFGWLLGAGALVSVALLLTLTRSMWAGAAAGGIWLLWNRKKWFVIAMPVLAAIVLLVNPSHVRKRAMDVIHPPPDHLNSAAHRSALRRTGWEMIKAHPLVGVGPEQVGPRFMDYLPADLPHPFPVAWYKEHLHNIYFHYAAERGVPALLALLWFLGRALVDFFNASRRVPDHSEARWVLHGAIAVIIAMMVSGWGEVNLHGQVLALFLSVLACGYVAAEQRANS